MKLKSKIGYLGEINSILPWQMAIQYAVEVIDLAYRNNYKIEI